MQNTHFIKLFKNFISAYFLLSCITGGFVIAQARDVSNTKTLNEQSGEYAGIVGDLDLYSFNLSQSESILIEVTQPNADLKLVVFNAEVATRSTPIFEASIPAINWISERVLVNADQCTSCILQIQPVDKVDKSGNYQLKSRRLSHDSQLAEIKFESITTSASIQWLGGVTNQDENIFNKIAGIYLKSVDYANKFHFEKAGQRSLYLAAQASHFAGNYKKQEELLLKIKHLENNKNDLYWMLRNFELGVIEYEKSNIKQASSYFDMAKQLAQIQSAELMQAKINNQLGLIAGRSGNQQEAAKYYEMAFQAFLSSGDWRNSIQALINLGWSNFRLRNFDTALNYYHQALSYATKTELLEFEVDALTKIGTLYARINDIDQAIHFIDLALANSDKFSHSVLDGRAKQAKARILLNAGMFELAKDVFNEALAAYSKVGATADEINILYLLGKVHNNLGNYTKAGNYYQKVLEFDKKNGNNYDIGTGYNRLAETALEQGKYTQALHYQQQSLKHLDEVEDDELKGRLYSQSAIVYFYNGQTKKAESYFHRATQIQLRIEDELGLIDTQYRIAVSEAANGNKKEAIKILSGVIERVHLHRSKITRNDLRRSFLALQQKIVGLQIGLMRDTHASEVETLKIAEMFRSLTLSESLKQLANKKVASITLSNKREKLQQALQSRVISYHQLADPVSRQKIVKETRKIAAQLQQIQVPVNTRGRENELKRPISVDIAKLQQRLKSESLILYFDTNPLESYLWSISNDKIELFDLPSDAIISRQISDVLNLVKSPPDQNNSKRIKKQNNVIEILSDTLFSGINIAWNNYENIIVIPDGPLNYLPFSLLSLPKQQTKLVENKKISYASSLGVLVQLGKEQQRSAQIDRQQNNILLIANPRMLNVANSSYNVASLRGGFETSELPYSQKEADSIIRVAGDKVLLLNQEMASKKELFSKTLVDYKILHFATHGLANSDAPSLGGLVLSNVLSNNNLLLTPEIANLNINAELVVLSGCETAIGQLVDGEGLQGLSRSFFEAGAKRVIASLWSVQDDATAELMSAFYQSLLEDKTSPAEALRLAKLQVKNYQRKNQQKPWKDPFYWAGFVLQGTEETWVD